MLRTKFRGSLTSLKVDLIVNMGNPFVNLTIDGFLKIGTVVVAKTMTEEAYHIVKRDVKHVLKTIGAQSDDNVAFLGLKWQ
ncbi:outer envelope pore protein 16, chloroplastic-like [Diospyros lotus]|uniref:outer envelope pore protein 16, chloroplastic-like n=1 Tax=Diospyros lotus TaxID=55363 RepID=UPI00225665B7|nr:outer envelope pore protein 16, chloroplastic-like [Diospyros lotus]